ncbi:MerR family transcriptional regulator [Dokdonella sp.]|uniref:MerR family transcriptional regulator n=1 Tax=Dokdonella sp. TaxID=2291710 RepID=UPI002F3E2F34
MSVRYTVSQIARRTGLTVRALHHYEAAGLLRPVARSAAGYRVYGEAELLRLQHIVSLKALGLSLADIRACIHADAPSLGDALARQIDRLRHAIVRQHELLGRLERIAQRLAEGGTIDAETLFNSIEATITMENHFSSEQLEAIKARGEALGAERIREVERAWPDVIAGMQAALALDKDPASPEVRALARRWRSLVREFTGGDAGILQSMNAMFRAEPAAMQARTGIDSVLMAYAAKAVGLLGED